MKITNDAYNGLSQIAGATKADCWFFLSEDEEGNDIVLDLELGEEGVAMDWKTALFQLGETIIEPLDSMGLSREEKEAVIELYSHFDLDPEENVL